MSRQKLTIHVSGNEAKAAHKAMLSLARYPLGPTNSIEIRRLIKAVEPVAEGTGLELDKLIEKHVKAHRSPEEMDEPIRGISPEDPGWDDFNADPEVEAVMHEPHAIEIRARLDLSKIPEHAVEKIPTEVWWALYDADLVAE